MSETKIVPVKLGSTHSYFLICNDSVIVIDVGVKGYKRSFEKTLAKHGLSLDSVSLIILTHTHYDHCRGVHDLKERTGAPVLVHQYEEKYLRTGKSKLPRGTKWYTDAMTFLGRNLVPSVGNYQPVNPDVVINDVYHLDSFGCSGYVLPTPGHSAGSISVVLNHNYDAIVGDLMFGIVRDSIVPFFADDPDLMAESWKMLLDRGCQNFYPAHGKPLDRIQVEENYKAYGNQ